MFPFKNPETKKKNQKQTFMTCFVILKKFLQRFYGELSGLTQFLATEGHLKMMKNTFYFISKASPFVLKIFKLFSWFFAHVTKPLGKKDQVNFKFYDVTTWLTNNRNTHIAKYFEKSRQADQETRLINIM